MIIKMYTYDKKFGHRSCDTDNMIIESVNKFDPGLKGRISVKRAESGKPYLEIVCDTASGATTIGDTTIGVTHTDREVFIALSKSRFGIDAERFGRARKIADFKRIAERFFTRDEQLYIGDSCERFLDIWVSKEAYVKCFGMGIGDMRSFSVMSLRGKLLPVNNDDNLIKIYVPPQNADLEVEIITE